MSLSEKREINEQQRIAACIVKRYTDYPCRKIGMNPCASCMHHWDKENLINSIEDDINKEKKTLCKVRAVHDGLFHGIECYDDETEDKWGFFNSDCDVRPGHARWIKKDDAERLWEIFERKILEEKSK